MRCVPAHRQQSKPDETDDHTIGRNVELEVAQTEAVEKTEGSALGLASNTLTDESDGRHVLVVSLPEISGIDDIALDISSTAVAVQVPLRPRLVVPLPREVDSSGAVAKFSKKSR